MTLQSAQFLAPAKLNLFLHITGRRKDGYHELQTLFQLLDYGDHMEFEVDSSGILSLHIASSQAHGMMPLWTITWSPVQPSYCEKRPPCRSLAPVSAWTRSSPAGPG